MSFPQVAKDNPLKTGGAVILSILGLFAGIIGFDDRYAKADDLNQQQHAIEEIRKQSSQTLDLLTTQMMSRKTVLEMKAAEDKITPEQQVELDNLKKVLK